jgi:hypothetical protein
MGRQTLSSEAYTRVASRAAAEGSASFAGEQRMKRGEKLHDLVDPAGFYVIRRSKSWYEPSGKQFKLIRGVAMLEETRSDTTSSMGNNVDIIMRVLPITHALLQTGADAVLGRYDVQMINGVFNDVEDRYVLCRSQAEIDERIAEQLTLMVPERAGGDIPEDPQYGLFGAAFLTSTYINRYGLKYYDFTISDAPGRDRIDPHTVIRVFGKEVYDKIDENRKEVDPDNEFGMMLPSVSPTDLPSTKEVVDQLKKRAHAFFLQVGASPSTGMFWRRIYGNENVVQIPSAEYVPFVKAAIIGLTEGTLNLQSVGDFLADNMAKAIKSGTVHKQHGSSIKAEADLIVRSVSGIPIGAQAALPNFHKIPLKGSVFANRGDLWPISADDAPAAQKPTKRIKWK